MPGFAAQSVAKTKEAKSQTSACEPQMASECFRTSPDLGLECIIGASAPTPSKLCMELVGNSTAEGVATTGLQELQRLHATTTCRMKNLPVPASGGASHGFAPLRLRHSEAATGLHEATPNHSLSQSRQLHQGAGLLHAKSPRASRVHPGNLPLQSFD